MPTLEYAVCVFVWAVASLGLSEPFVRGGGRFELQPEGFCPEMAEGMTPQTRRLLGLPQEDGRKSAQLNSTQHFVCPAL